VCCEGEAGDPLLVTVDDIVSSIGGFSGSGLDVGYIGLVGS
jgi:hypothetical protein